MKKWEYLVESTDEWEGASYMQDKLNEWGRDGWELVSVSDSLRTYFLKRELLDD